MILLLIFIMTYLLLYIAIKTFCPDGTLRIKIPININIPCINEKNHFKVASYFHGSLVVVAIILGWIAGIDPFANIIFSEMAVLYGVIGTIPLFIFFVALYQIQIDAFQQIKRTLLETLAPSIHRYHWTDLFILGAFASIAEEILFRGVIQPWLESTWGLTGGLI